MSMNDPLGDLFTRIRNAQMRKKSKVSTPGSRLRANVLEVLGQLYVRTAHAKGLPPLKVVLRHVLSNTLVGTVTILGLEAGWLLAGTVYIETVFAWPGLGAMLVNAILQRDYPLVQGGVLLVAGVYVIINLATDTLYLYIDPRLRHG